MVRISVRYRDGASVSDVVGRVLARSPLVLERRDGRLVEVPEHAIVSSKQVPDRPLRTRPAAHWRPDELLAVCSRGWVALESVPDGDWELRSSAGFTKRANSAAAHGDPADLAEVIRFYADRGLPAMVQVVSGTSWDRRLRGSGWSQVGKVTRVLVKDLALGAAADNLPRVPSARWLDLYGDDSRTALAVLQHHTGAFPIADDAAIARVVVTGEWAGISCVKVAESQRRRRLATALVARCEAWAAQLADKVYVQVVDREIESLYGDYDLHHEYVYLAGPESADSASTVFSDSL